MANKGFYIKSVVVKGEQVQDTQVDFVKGCNVIYGPSDTGKTSLYSVIEFLLGKSSNPKIPLEGKGYTDFLMEIHTYGEEKETNRKCSICSRKRTCMMKPSHKKK
jgi:AAA15 family ATPase/GTPase